MNKEKIAEFLIEMMEVLTLRRIALIAILTTVLISLFTIYEYRNAVFATIYRSADTSTIITWDLSQESKTQLDGLTNITLVGAVFLHDVNLKKNRQTIKYQFVKDRATAEYLAPLEAAMLPQALFDYDSKNTEQMVSMLNNEFSCSTTRDTMFGRQFVELHKRYPMVCRIAVPPFFGEFVGYVSVLLTRQPTRSELDALKIEMNRLAIETYLRDISKKLPS